MTETRESLIRQGNLDAREYNKTNGCDECKEKARSSIERWWNTMIELREKGNPLFSQTLDAEYLSTPEKRWDEFGDLKTFKIHTKHEENE